MALSTSIPTARANPPKDMTLRLTPVVNMAPKEATIETGMAKPIIQVRVAWPKKR